MFPLAFLQGTEQVFTQENSSLGYHEDLLVSYTIAFLRSLWEAWAQVLATAHQSQVQFEQGCVVV